ncbi:hypothetical protein JCM5296_005759, partial [Sporobolomyces johnsonii]
MKPPLATNALPPDLAARFAALRAPSRPPQDGEREKEEGQSLDFDERLKKLEPPRAEESDPMVDDEAEDEAVARFLSLATPPSDPDPFPRSRQPIPGSSALDTLSGIEIEFMRPSLGSAVGDFSLDAGAEAGTGGEADDLLRRMRDELAVEASTRRRAGASAERWEARLGALKGVAAAAGPTRREVEERERLGKPPELGELAKEAGSALPYKRSAPRWLKISAEEVKEHIFKLARKGLTPSQIGVILRDSHGVAQVKSVTGNKILRILKTNGLAPQIPEDLYHLIKKAVQVRKHLERNRHDK